MMVNPTRSLKLASALVIVAAVAAIAIQPAAAGNGGGVVQAPAAQSTATPKPTASPTPRPKATSTTAPKPTATKPAAAKPAATPKPAATKDAGIVVQPISKAANVKSYKTVVTMALDGKSAGKPAKGDLNVEMQSIPASKKHSIAISGSLLGTLLGQYLPIPVSKLTVYLIDKQTYIFAQSLLSVCAVPKNAIPALDQLRGGLSADVFVSSLTGSNKIYGTKVGEETVNGIPSVHYKLDAAVMNALAKANKVDAQLKSGDIWLAKDGGWVVRFIGDVTGNLSKSAGVDFAGNANIALNVSDVNKIQDIPLPTQCNRPIQI